MSKKQAVAEPNVPRAGHLPPAQAEANDAVRRLVALGRSIDIEIPESLEARKQAAVELQANIDEQSAKLGFVLLAIKEEMGHGEWQPWLQASGIATSSARRHMQVARMLQELPDPKRSRVSVLPLRKQIELAKLSADEVSAMIDEGALSAIEEEPAEQTKELVAMRRRVAKAEEEARESRNHALVLEERLAQARHFDKRGLALHVRRLCTEEAAQLRVLSAGVLDELAEAIRELPPEEDGVAIGEVLAAFQWSLYATEQQVKSLRRQVAERYERYWDPEHSPLPPAVSQREAEDIERAEYLMDSELQSRKAARAQDADTKHYRRLSVERREKQ